MWIFSEEKKKVKGEFCTKSVEICVIVLGVFVARPMRVVKSSFAAVSLEDGYEILFEKKSQEGSEKEKE